MDVILRRSSSKSPVIPGFEYFLDKRWDQTIEETNRYFDYIDTSYDLPKVVRQSASTQVKNLIVANECFCPSGLKNNYQSRSWGHDWIKKVCDLVKSKNPSVNLWINEFRPRQCNTYRKIIEYIDLYQLPIYGVGIQVHAMLNPLVPGTIASPQNCAQILEDRIELIQSAGLQVAFTEVTGWAQNPKQRGLWYQEILDLAIDNGLEFTCLWSPTPRENWRYKKRDFILSHLWDDRGELVVPVRFI